MSAWIESHQSLSRHRKTLRAVAILKIDRHKFIGHMHELWWWALDNVPLDGWLGNLSDEEIAAGAQWAHDAVQDTCTARAEASFAQAITTAGFIDVDANGERWLHDWYDYAGKLLKRRADNAERMREARAAQAQETKAACSGDVQDTCAARAPATVPNRTEQNHTKESLASASLNADIQAVYAHYQLRIKPGARLTDKAVRKIKTRFKAGFTVEQLKTGIDHFADDYWYPPNCGNETIAWFFDSDDRSDKFFNMVPRPHPPGLAPNGRSTAPDPRDSITAPLPRFDELGLPEA